MNEAPRDPRSEAPHLGMDLSRDTATIHGDLRARWPHASGMWWELDPDETSGWVYAGDNRILAKLVHVGTKKIRRWFCLFRSSFRYDAAPNISHETIDKVKTLCGRKVSDAETLEEDNREHAEPDCIRCRNTLARRRKQPAKPEIEAQLKCDTCAPGHEPGSLRKPCGVSGCECWCNRCR